MRWKVNEARGHEKSGGGAGSSNATQERRPFTPRPRSLSPRPPHLRACARLDLLGDLLPLAAVLLEPQEEHIVLLCAASSSRVKAPPPRKNRPPHQRPTIRVHVRFKFQILSGRFMIWPMAQRADVARHERLGCQHSAHRRARCAKISGRRRIFEHQKELNRENLPPEILVLRPFRQLEKHHIFVVSSHPRGQEYIGFAGPVEIGSWVAMEGFKTD